MTTAFLIGWPGGSLESALKLGGLVLGTYAFVLWLSAVIWVYRDIRNRTNDAASQVIAVLLVAILNVPGLIIYLVIRPQSTLSDAYERSLEAEAVLHELQLTANSCQTCRRPIDDDFNVCPHCRTVLREGCRACSRLVRTSWQVCPYCATDRTPRQQQQQPAPAGVAATAPLQPPVRREATITRRPDAPPGSAAPRQGTTAPRPPVAR